MASFVPGIDTAVRATDPHLDVMASTTQPLQPGRHIFQLVVTDNAGNLSEPARVTVLVKDRTEPSAVIDYVREDGTRLYNDEIVVAYGRPFRLTGERSSDANGRIASYSWRILSPA